MSEHEERLRLILRENGERITEKLDRIANATERLVKLLAERLPPPPKEDK